MRKDSTAELFSDASRGGSAIRPLVYNRHKKRSRQDIISASSPKSQVRVKTGHIFEKNAAPKYLIKS